MVTERMKLDILTSTEGKQLVHHSPYVVEVPSNTAEYQAMLPRSRNLLLLSGPSGGGKDSLIRQIEEHPENMGLRYPLEMVRTATTRSEIRQHERGRDPHIRLTREEFERRHHKGDFLESNFGFPTGDLYGSPVSELERIMAAGRTPVLRINHTGAKEVLKLWRDNHPALSDVNVVYAFIVPPDVNTLRSRLIKRAEEDGLLGVEAEAKADSRFKIALEEIQGATDAHFILVNHDNSLDRLRKEVFYNILPRFNN